MNDHELVLDEKMGKFVISGRQALIIKQATLRLLSDLNVLFAVAPLIGDRFVIYIKKDQDHLLFSFFHQYFHLTIEQDGEYSVC